MADETAHLAVLMAAVAGLALSIAIERLMVPMPGLLRPWRAWGQHAGLWLTAYGVLVLLLGRPWFSACGLTAFILMLVLVSNAKTRALREPFIFQDHSYFTDAIRHPRLYIPFIGWTKFLYAAAGFLLAVAVGLWGESVPAQRFSWTGQSGEAAIMLGIGALLLLAGKRRPLPVSFNPDRDVRALGLLSSLWRYGEEALVMPTAVSPFDSPMPTKPASDLPHLVAVQSESFFDPRTLYQGIRADVLREFDRLKTEAQAYGKLKVPAWGANTVRTEFAFLSGMDASKLGVHRFHPYRAVAAGWKVLSLPAFLKRLGYRTICIHPYPASFYLRDRVFPRLGFDAFLDIRSFVEAKHNGPYIGDAAVADKVASILEGATAPVFIFAITMENHGPLHLERVERSDIDDLYTEAPPTGCEDLTIYLRHLRNADGMAGVLRRVLEHCGRPAGLCWFGDHVPIMPSVYDALGAPTGDVEYLFWSNRMGKREGERDLAAHDASLSWLRFQGVIH